MAASLSSDAGAQAANLALRIGSNAADAISFALDLGEGLSILSPVSKTLKAIREKVETVKHNREELKALEERCTYVMAWVVVKFKENRSSQIDVTPLTKCVKDVEAVVERCGRRGRIRRVVKASSDKDDIAQLNARVDRLAGDMGLASHAVLEGKVDELKAKLESMEIGRHDVKLAKVPSGTPVRKAWHVERHHVTDAVLKALTSDGGQRLVGLVGDSGAGKTTAASQIVRRNEVREAFSDGIVWLTVNEGASTRLPTLMQELARMVYEGVDGSVGRRPGVSEDGAAYIKQRMAAGEGSKCLVVADNVWEKEVVSKLLETGMWVLVSTRVGELVSCENGQAVGVDELSEPDAESVLRRAAELPSEARLPDDAVDLINLCGRVVMDLAFVGRWSTVRGRGDRQAWRGATKKVRKEMSEVGCDPENDAAEETRTKRRKAILRAGFEDLAIGSDDERVQRLYLSLAVMPDGRAFSVKDSAVLLNDGTPSSEDEASVERVVGVLERWSVLRSVGRAYRMHDAHSSFAREGLLDRGDVRRPALRRWVEYISSLDALRAIAPHALKDIWLAVEGVGGDGWVKTSPYEKALTEIDESGRLLRDSLDALGLFQSAHEDWEGASTTFRRLVEVEKSELGPGHPFVVNSYGHLACLADELGKAEEADKWRKKEREELPLALARMQHQESVGFDHEEDLEGILVLISLQSEMDPDNRTAVNKLLRRWMTIFEPKEGLEDEDMARALSQLGLWALEAWKLEKAENLLRRCLAIREAKLGPDDYRVVSTLNQLRECARKADQRKEADKVLRRCLATKEATLGPEDLQMIYKLRQLGIRVLEAGWEEEAEKLFRRYLAIEEENLSQENVQMAIAFYKLGVCLQSTGRLDEGEKLLSRCLAIEQASLDPEDLQVGYTLHRLGVCVREAGRLEEAEKLLRRCLSIKEAKLGLGNVQLTDTLLSLGVCLQREGRLGEAETLWKRCLAIKEAKLIPEDLQVAAALHKLRVWVQKEGRPAEAEEVLRSCLSIEEAMLGPKGWEVAYTLHELGECVREAGRLDEAEVLLRRCSSINEANLGPEDVSVAYTLHELGRCVREAGRLDEAEVLLRRCLSINEAKLGPEDVSVAYTLRELGKCVREAGRLEEAEDLFRRCLAMEEAKLCPEDVPVAYTLRELGKCVREAGRLREAEDLLRRCLAMEEAKANPKDLQMAHALYWLGECVREAGRFEEAEELFRRCLNIDEAQPISESVNVARTLHQLSVCVRELGRLEKAEEMLQHILGIIEASLGHPDAEVGGTLDRQPSRALRQQEWLVKAKNGVQECLAIGEAKLGSRRTDMDKALEELGVFLLEAGKFV